MSCQGFLTLHIQWTHYFLIRIPIRRIIDQRIVKVNSYEVSGIFVSNFIYLHAEKQIIRQIVVMLVR